MQTESPDIESVLLDENVQRRIATLNNHAALRQEFIKHCRRYRRTGLHSCQAHSYPALIILGLASVTVMWPSVAITLAVTAVLVYTVTTIHKFQRYVSRLSAAPLTLALLRLTADKPRLNWRGVISGNLYLLKPEVRNPNVTDLMATDLAGSIADLSLTLPAIKENKWCLVVLAESSAISISQVDSQ